MATTTNVYKLEQQTTDAKCYKSIAARPRNALRQTGIRCHVRHTECHFDLFFASTSGTPTSSTSKTHKPPRAQTPTDRHALFFTVKKRIGPHRPALPPRLVLLLLLLLLLEFWRFGRGILFSALGQPTVVPILLTNCCIIKKFGPTCRYVASSDK